MIFFESHSVFSPNIWTKVIWIQISVYRIRFHTARMKWWEDKSWIDVRSRLTPSECGQTWRLIRSLLDGGRGLNEWGREKMEKVEGVEGNTFGRFQIRSFVSEWCHNAKSFSQSPPNCNERTTPRNWNYLSLSRLNAKQNESEFSSHLWTPFHPWSIHGFLSTKTFTVRSVPTIKA